MREGGGAHTQLVVVAHLLFEDSFPEVLTPLVHGFPTGSDHVLGGGEVSADHRVDTRVLADRQGGWRWGGED